MLGPAWVGADPVVVPHPLDGLGFGQHGLFDLDGARETLEKRPGLRRPEAFAPCRSLPCTCACTAMEPCPEQERRVPPCERGQWKGVEERGGGKGAVVGGGGKGAVERGQWWGQCASLKLPPPPHCVGGWTSGPSSTVRILRLVRPSSIKHALSVHSPVDVRNTRG